ncbi:(2Fe-2S) ferredoxin domain-containing protein [Alkalitalea saponilacus]|uniref:Thioredoxin-like [2Fe-2S] ferredoxin n=1 Tax=Alkalitalea saponilacus TaxID=889453 RepID=A0A1T5BBA0_9BACT|nr:(2Fe-2S) ferredoxin domain-containing protein [Alkalitalea saponilacus]ASB49724.1 electron transport complex protein RnfG [Alkalitalea saponilacus]SKB44564.1 Thioredoxin-like [2Fe-2S] ferredoxin [Alkalitalea saponilacus]
MNQEHRVTICLGSSCFSRGNKHVLEIVKSYLREHNLEPTVFFSGELCTGLCEEGPVLKIDGNLYKAVSSENIYEILDEYFGHS